VLRGPRWQVIRAKRLQRAYGRFPRPQSDRIELTSAEVLAVVEGTDLKQARGTCRFALPQPIPKSK